MGYISLYRKWRPQNFADIAGQRNIVRTLKNAIKMNRIAHAYLFCGPRGTGKTSTAKILTKALNCEEGPTVTPCDECEACSNVENNNPVDMIEIDAASNRGIDKIREMRQKIKSSPLKGKYKVYIIDEVHMLTTEAFNALLKTLEEPPDYVIFILATTEPHKLLPTILSRCQRFDFSRLSIEDIKGRLDYIAKQEGIEVSLEVLATIARNADGGMRDAISILDQVISFAGNKITLDDVASVLGMVGNESLFKLVDIIIEQDTEAGLNLINEVINQGKNIRQFVLDLIHHFRNLLLIKECKNTEKLIEATDDTRARLIKQADSLRTIQLLRLIETLNEVDYNLKETTQPRVVLEMGIIKLIKLEEDKSLDSILDRLIRLEEIVERGTIIDDKEDKKSNKPKDKEKKEQINPPKNASKEEKNYAISAGDDISLEQVKAQWDNILDCLEGSMTLHSVLKYNIQLNKVENGQLFVSLKNDSSFYRETLEKGKQKLAQALKKFLGVNLQVKSIFSRNNAKDGSNKKKQVLEHPLVKEALDIFDGQVVQVESLD